MPVLDDLKEVFARAKSARSRRGPEPATEALDQLRDSTVAELARFAGQTLEELDATFELLPLGTRLELEQVGALELVEGAGDRFGVRVRPFAVDLVNGANERLLASVTTGEPGDLEARVNAVVAAERSVDLPLEPASSSQVASHEPKQANLIGTVRAKAVAEAIDGQSRLGVLRILDPEDTDRSSESLPAVTFALDRAAGHIASGVTIEVEMVVTRATPKMQGRSAWSSMRGRKGISQPKVGAEIESVKGRIPTVVTAHGIYMPVMLEGHRATLVDRQAPAANAVAEVTSVTGAAPQALTRGAQV